MFLPFLKFNNSTTVGLDIGNNLVKLVELEIKGSKRLLTKLAIAETPPGTIEKGKITNPEVLGEVIRVNIKANGLASKNVVMGLTGKNVIIRQVRFPLMESEELRETLKWELDRYLPLAPDDSIVDFHILQHFSEINPSEMEVVLVGVNREIINGYLQLAECAELELKAIEVTSFALLRTLDTDNISGTIVVVNAGTTDLEMSILHNGLLRFSRVIPNAPLDILLKEIQRSMDFHQAQNRQEFVGEIILSGGHPQLESLAQVLQQEMRVNVKRADPFMLIESSPVFDPAYLKKISPILGVGIGLALRQE